jgi:hypothetical protein
VTLDWRVTPSDGLRSELGALREFVDWLREAYPDLVGVVVKPCWSLHADMRHSLAAFRLAWREAMSRDRGDMGISVIHWEDELERACAGRWRASMSSCDESGCARARRAGQTVQRERRAAEEVCGKVDISTLRAGLPPLSTAPKVRRSNPAAAPGSSSLRFVGGGGGTASDQSAD